MPVIEQGYKIAETAEGDQCIYVVTVEARKRRLSLFIESFRMEEAMDELYCKIFINTRLPRYKLSSMISEIFDGQIERRTVSCDGFEVDIIENDDWNQAIGFEVTDFVYFPYYLEIGAESGFTHSSFIEAVQRILICLWEKHIPAVASCDFEDLLLNKGNKISFGSGNF